MRRLAARVRFHCREPVPSLPHLLRARATLRFGGPSSPASAAAAAHAERLVVRATVDGGGSADGGFMMPVRERSAKAAPLAFVCGAECVCVVCVCVGGGSIWPM